MATKVDLDVWRGSRRVLVFTVYDGDGNVQDVTGWAVRFNVRVSHGSPGTVLSLSTATSGVTLSSPSAGEVTVTMAAASLAAFAAGSYRHTLARTDAGSETVLAEGAFRLRANSVLPVA